MVWVVTFLLFFPSIRQETGLEGSLAWKILGELGTKQEHPQILRGILLRSYSPTRDGNRDRASVSTAGPVPALLSHQERLFCKVVLVWRGPFNLRKIPPSFKAILESPF